jgi:hypothetical protein
MPDGRYPVTWTADVISTHCPWPDALWAAEPLLQLDALRHSQDGDPDGALTSARALLNVGRSLGNEPIGIASMTRNGCRWETARAIERTLAQGEPSEAALAEMQEALRREDEMPLFLLYFRGDRALTHQLLKAVDDGDRHLFELGGYPPPPGMRRWAEKWYYREDAIRVHARYLRAMNQAVEIARLPLEEQYPRYKQWRKEYGQVENVGGACCLGDDGKEVGLLTGHAHLRCALVTVAAERYRRKHGNWPRTIANLVPDYLSAVPLDPFDAKPLRYRRTDCGAVVYSVGGDPSPPPAPRALRDVVFTLWNVDQRRQPPKPAEKENAGRR